MKIIDEMDYPTLLWMMQQPSWQYAVKKCSYTGLINGIETEGMRGYISINVELDINDIEEFANLSKARFNDNNSKEILAIRSRVLNRK